jgi:hypothetical protein
MRQATQYLRREMWDGQTDYANAAFAKPQCLVRIARTPRDNEKVTRNGLCNEQKVCGLRCKSLGRETSK